MFFRKFRARKPNPTPPEPAAKTLVPGLSPEKGLELRKELRQHFAGHGAAIHFEGTSGVITHPTKGRIRVNFENLVRALAGNENPYSVSRHAEAFVQAIMTEDGTDTMRDPEIYAGLRLKLTATAGLSESEKDIIDSATIAPFARDIAITLVLDTEHTIQTVALGRAEDFDDIPSLQRAAGANLRSELQHAAVEVVHHPGTENAPGAHFWSFESDSFYLGSAAIYLEDFLRQRAPGLDQSNGVIFAVPNRHLLLAREVSTGTDLLEGLHRLAMVAARFALERAHPISPSLHLTYAGGLETISEIDQQARELKIMPNPHLTHQLGLSDESGDL
ncbi:hypothetical protein COCCU_04690 [Corynebacterium occultum]|uniref:Uncharacterized protein n=1 Tax=Corynebacterium occultum TaxID=2675219 RepID=A0A6B8W063_9CORY|nr:hypothetical protein [Corynebacterium occultum]QGU06884.1 hypothetical protein COCCU_04690 [Corynebacterium occultum]